MGARALAAFLALPGVVAFLIPALVTLRTAMPAGPNVIALVPMAIGTCGLLMCVRDFYATGKGTLATWAPPASLVTVRLYRFSRNPMYLSVLLLLLGWAWLAGSQVLVMYALVVAAVFHAHVVVVEEPWAERTFGARWTAYKASVPRWIGIAAHQTTLRDDA